MPLLHTAVRITRSLLFSALFAAYEDNLLFFFSPNAISVDMYLKVDYRLLKHLVVAM